MEKFIGYIVSISNFFKIQTISFEFDHILPACSFYNTSLLFLRQNFNKNQVVVLPYIEMSF